MKQFDPTTLEIYRALFTSVAEEMGIALRRTAFSPNIKERRDYSCAVFDRAGRVIAQGDHMPVHLGSMPMAVAAALEEINLQPGDVVALNDPYAGGTHLPDVTLVSGLWDGRGDSAPRRHGDTETRGDGDAATARHGDTETRRHGDSAMGRSGATEKRLRSNINRSPHRRVSASLPPLFYVANRAHHADIGGATPGSMGLASDIYGEGLRIPPLRLVRNGELDTDTMRLILANVRGQHERQGDFQAQIGSLKTGARRLLEIVDRRGTKEASEYAEHLIAYSARVMRRVIKEIPDGRYQAEDLLDDDGISNEPIVLRVQLTIKGESAVVDFSGSAAQVAGPINAVAAITVSAVSYVFRCLLTGDMPASAGLMEPITVVAPAGTVVNAVHPASVAGGNVETSQRIVDVLFKALSQAVPERIPAASQGTMNNLTIGGIDTRSGKEFSYYETVAGGMGARPRLDGMSAVHTHMTNSLNTPVEALEYAYPLRVREYCIRKGSGGKGKHNGGDGVVREIETLVPARMSLLSDRRKIAPYGLRGGDDAAVGKAAIVSEGRPRSIASKGSWNLNLGDRVRIETPGGGGIGRRNTRK